jgi:predicted RNA-binding Zn-ribbon protein involved in translation (DUF1610 family)
MDNSNVTFNKWQYSVFVKNGVDGQLVVRSNDEEEFWGMVKKLNEYVIQKNGGQLPLPVKQVSAVVDDKPQSIDCPQCGEVMQYRSGVGKTSGKPYKAWFCTSGDRSHTQWLK